MNEPRDAWEERFYAQASRQTERRADGDNLVGAGIGCAILLPVAGIVIGIVLLFKDRVGPGLGVMLLSVVAMVVYYALFIG